MDEPSAEENDFWGQCSKSQLAVPLCAGLLVQCSCPLALSAPILSTLKRLQFPKRNIPKKTRLFPDCHKDYSMTGLGTNP